VVKGLEEKTGKSVDDLIALQEDEEMPQSQEDPLPQEDLNTLKMVHYYRDSIRFIEQIHVAMPSVCDLLGSKNASDVIETIQFFIMAHNFSIEKARDGVRKMLLLVWSKEANIKQAVCDAFVTLYLSPPKSLDSAKRRCLYIVKNLIAWTLDSNLGELTSLEELVVTLSKDGKIPGPVVDMLWEVFAQKYKKDKASEGRGALIVLSMLANTDPSIVKNQLNILVKIGLGPRAYRDPTLAKWTCIALQKLSNRTTTSSPSTATTKKEKDAEKAASEAAAAASASAPHVRYNSSHLLFAKLAQLVKSDIATSKWFPAAEQAINAIFLLAENPDVLMGTIVREMAVGLFPQIFPGVTVTTGKLTSPETSPTKGKKPPVDDDEDMDVDAEEESVEGVPAGVVAGKDHALSRVGKLSKLFFVLGHSAIKQLVYVEEVIKAMKMKNDQQSKKKAAASTTKSSKKGGKKSAGKGQEDDEDLEAIEKELGVTNADTAEDETSRRKVHGTMW
jgi:condensin complex subunit 1